MEILKIDHEFLLGYLLAAENPLMEAVLLRALFGNINININDDNLYRAHFSLYHALYMLKSARGKEGYYFHLDPMRIRVLKIPDSGRCGYYFADRGFFCGDDSGERGFCSVHHPAQNDFYNSVTLDILRDFYENPENVNFGMDGILRKLSAGIILYSLRKGEVERAKKFFGISYPDKKLVVKKYRELAFMLHPDRNGGNEEKMKELNLHYQVLREIFIL